MLHRCDELIVQMVVRTYNEDGLPVGERVSQPVKLFRATAPDVWGDVDRTIVALHEKLAATTEGR
jgi:hypothetical protein